MNITSILYENIQKYIKFMFFWEGLMLMFYSSIFIKRVIVFKLKILENKTQKKVLGNNTTFFFEQKGDILLIHGTSGRKIFHVFNLLLLEFYYKNNNQFL